MADAPQSAQSSNVFFGLLLPCAIIAAPLHVVGHSKVKHHYRIATEHREQGRADIRQRIEQVRLVPLADMLGSELGGHDHVEGVASATYALGIEVQVDDPGLFHGKLRTRYQRRP